MIILKNIKYNYNMKNNIVNKFKIIVIVIKELIIVMKLI